MAKKEKLSLLSPSFFSIDSHIIDFFIGATLCVAFFLVVYGPSTLDVIYDSWIYTEYIEHDIIQS